MKEIRMLAAIMFTDMVGYTALMQENERKAKILRDKHRVVLDRLILEHRGQILQYYGDGTLSIFGSAIEAAVCGAKIQQELQSEPQVPLRIGIHAGDVVYDDEGVYGDGVNIASRIENLAVPGSVLISDKINDELKNQTDVSSVFLGRYELKNVKSPVKIYAIKMDGLVIPSPDQLEGKSAISENSIAVLPFINLSTDKENEYFSDGVTEELLNALAKVDGLLVTSRTSSFAFKGKNTDIREIGKTLGVKTVLEGSVRKYGNRVRVTAQLINSENGYHKWSETFDRNIEDIFAVQDELANSIVDQLKKTIKIHKSIEQLVKAPTENMDAYNLFLKGLDSWNKWSPDFVLKAIKYFEDAVAISSDFTAAYARLSACYSFLGAAGFMSNNVAYAKAKEYAEKAYKLDSSALDSRLAFGVVKYFNDWDWEGAEKCFLKAIEINPNSAEAHQYYAMLLSTLGYHKKALKESEIANQLDPLNAPISYILSFVYFNNNRTDLAIEQHKKTIELDPEFGDTWNSLAWIYLKSNDFQKGMDIFNQNLNQPAFKLKAISGLGYAYGKLGQPEKSKEYIQMLNEINSEQLPTNMEQAIIYTGLGEFDSAFDLLFSAIDKRLSGLNFINGKYWKELHDHPKFKEILQRMNLPPD
ncbi:MAG: tetratricopeptide repeat protein [Ignavibacteriota bacterium]|jgi:TolB-like protein/Tfp pilus assembly protein PilF|nr:guanylate cyclase [Ignavibacteriota bacterium]MCC7092834.1 tetratricopeptide repeat protein [Ignavibacteriaceae bacterium]MEB2295222.1 tetratricopeptide repeat protein [Ignavibacteria bacterium]NUM62047.1 tetratricopeptide repeat protein [Ignavibacteriaceae bacterium]QKJ97712.1 MAG: tetratricopeptide repeat protein [Ignavibacteriota bacterium]